MKKLRVGVIYGGRSGEHDVSIASAAAVIQNLDKQRYEPIPIRIEKDGRWIIADRLPVSSSAAEVIEQSRSHPGQRLGRGGREAHLLAHPGEEQIMTIERGDTPTITGLGLDVVFPVLHGPYGEDGTVQGLLELANIPYVGAGVLASAVGMDKAVAKLLFAARGLPQVKYAVVFRKHWISEPVKIARSITAELGYPVFVKPANLGSSVGISKVKSEGELAAAVNLAAEYDRKIVIEAAVPNAREIEIAVLGNDEPAVSEPGEIVPSREFYDFEAKYLDDTSRTIIPAQLPVDVVAEIKRLAVDVFQSLDCAGMARVDFFMDGATGELYVNEINTIPGFTTISMYSKMWAASGLTYPELLNRLIALARERHAEKQQLRTSPT
ncbi:MAG TPA: D-alanine--D-alanine ligase family protein [Vicinamibacterales bacterium]|nr:D-alanine--D-alanine ligase family protein [Vicinamibacterales bacterium]